MRKCKLMVSAIVAWAAASHSASAQTKPHILLIMTDQQRGEHTTLPNTPNVNIQKNECIVFFTSITKARTAKKWNSLIL